MCRITLDYTPLASGTEPFTPRRIARLEREAAAALRKLKGMRRRGKAGFLELPCASTAALWRRVRSSRTDGVDAVIVLGIGGSSLGTLAIREALLAPCWNSLSTAERGGLPRLYVLDNIDPHRFLACLERLDLSSTLVNVVSKSGGTAETAAQFLVVKDMVERAVGDSWPARFVITTAPGSNPLRRIARRHRIPTLTIPPGVGGRYSVLSAVGLFPAALCGVDVRGLLRGAANMAAVCLSEDPARNMALKLCTYYVLSYMRGRRVTVLMPYSERLRGVAMWFRQLWAESLGKRPRGRGQGVGPTPVVAMGATDQHSQLQLYLDGPDDKTFTFLEVERPGADVEIPRSLEEESFSYLWHNTMGDLLEAEMAATRRTLERRGRPCVALRLSSVRAETLGALFFLFETVTALAGYVLGVDPFDQPAVDEGKKTARKLLAVGARPQPTEGTKLMECVVG